MKPHSLTLSLSCNTQNTNKCKQKGWICIISRSKCERMEPLTLRTKMIYITVFNLINVHNIEMFLFPLYAHKKASKKMLREKCSRKGKVTECLAHFRKYPKLNVCALERHLWKFNSFHDILWCSLSIFNDDLTMAHFSTIASRHVTSSANALKSNY